MLCIVISKPAWIQKSLSEPVVSGAYGGGFKIKMLRSHPRDSCSLEAWWGLKIYFQKSPKFILYIVMIQTTALEARSKSIHVEIIPHRTENFPCGSRPRNKPEVKYYNQALLKRHFHLINLWTPL